MAHFYFNVRNGSELIRDREAYQFPTAQAARDAAVKAMRELVVEDSATLARRRIEIADATGHPISIVDIHDVLPMRMH